MTEDTGNDTPKRAYPYPSEIKEACRKIYMPPLHCHVLLDIVSRFGKKEFCYPKQKLVAYELGMPKDTLGRIIKTLKSKGILTKQKEVVTLDNGKQGMRTTFRLAPDGLRDAPPYPPKKHHAITYTMQNGSKTTIKPDYTVTTTPPPEAFEDSEKEEEGISWAEVRQNFDEMA